MQKLLSLTILISGLLIGLLFLGSSVKADGTNPACPSIYGAACPAGQLSVNKKVQHPRTGEFVDLINSGDITFTPSQEVNFRVEVKNTGSAAMSNIGASDKLPDFVNFVSGPGSFNKNNNTLTWTVDNLNSGESKFFQIKAQVKSQNELKGFDITCVTNFVSVTKDQQTAADNALFCIQNQIPKVEAIQNLPKTGPPAIILALGSLLPLGLFLKRLTGFSEPKSEIPLYSWQKREFDKN